MPFQISPGVNVSEIDLTTIVPAVATTTGAIAMHSIWGPSNTRVLVDSEDTLVNQFFVTGPNANTASDFFTAANFLSYGNSLQVVRVVSKSTGTQAQNATGNSANTARTFIENDDDYDENFSSGISNVGGWVAKFPGELGNNIRVSVCPSSAAFESTLTGNVAFTNNSVTVTGNGTAFSTELTVGDIILTGPDRTPRKVATITNNFLLTLQTKYVGNNVVANTTTGVSPTRRWEFFNEFDTAPGTSDFASKFGSSTDELHIIVADEDGGIYGTANSVIERFSKLSKASDAKTDDGSNNFYVDVINNQSNWVWWAAHNGTTTNWGTRAELGKTFGAASTVNNVSLVNGRDGQGPSDADYINALDEFKDPEVVDISFILNSAGGATRALHAIDNIAEFRNDCIVCISPERADVVNNSSYVGKEVVDTIAFRNSLRSTSFAFMDSGFKYQYDKYNDVFRYVPLNGDTAGLMVRSDNTRDPWYSPAGYNRGIMKNVVKLSFNPNKTQRDELYKNGINPVITQAGQGTLLFGDKTMLDKPSAFDRINVRRLFIVLEKAIATAAKFSLFEFNDEFTRAQFRNLVEPFLRDVQGRRGIFDFRVVCDETNNTGEVIDRNEFVGDIFIKPARSINFIQLNFVAVRTGVDFSEIVGQFG